MKRPFGWLVAAVLAGYGVATMTPMPVTSAQEKPATEAKEKKPSGRLPAYYAQIGLSTEQKEKIYAAQAKYGAQIEDLEKQIAALQEKRDGDITAVLTEDQKKQLDSLKAAAKEKSASRKKGGSDSAEKPTTKPK